MLNHIGLSTEASNVTVKKKAEGDHWECQTCAKKFKIQQHLYFHYCKQHEDLRTCDSCAKTFPSRVKFNIHVKKVLPLPGVWEDVHGWKQFKEAPKGS